MARTKLKRPLCNGKLSHNEARMFIITSLITGSYVLSTYCGNLAMLIGVGTMITYNTIYTPMKRRTPYNTEFGAIIGSLPPQIGIAACKYMENTDLTLIQVLNETIHDPLCIFSFLLLYAWQMPHFLYLSQKNKMDYIKGGFKMWSSNEFDDEYGSLCKKKSLNWSMALLPLPSLLAYTQVTSWMFAFDGTLVTGLYFASVVKWYNENNSKNGKTNGNNNSKYGRKSFLCNLLYLPTILFLVIIHSKRWKYKRGKDFFCFVCSLYKTNFSLCFAIDFVIFVFDDR